MIRIALTGGGTGGHVYPLVSVVEKLVHLGGNSITLRYYGPKSKWNEALTEHDVPLFHVAGAKLRRYASLQNFFDIPKFFFGLFEALVKLYFFMPDVVFSKGGPGALPVVLAAAWYRIPVVVHESDVVPGLTSRITAKFAKRICTAFREALTYFPEAKTTFTGNPVRNMIATARLEKRAAKSQLGMDPEAPLLLVLGGSQGAKALNDFIADAGSALAVFTSILHQTGQSHQAPAPNPEHRARFRSQEFLDEREMALALSAADLVLTRAGAGAIFECAAAGTPAILVPLARSANDHQRKNAAVYAATGAAVVLEENNLTPNLAVAEIKKLLGDMEQRKMMEERARAFYRTDAAEMIAREIIGAAGAKVS